MARTPTTSDAFNAVAEASRRDLLDAIGAGEVTVGELVDRLDLSQPQVSKHLGVLRTVDLVRVRPARRSSRSMTGYARSSVPGTSSINRRSTATRTSPRAWRAACRSQ
jgi:DNA-binding transcriptional ArsR family regulator